MPETPAADNLMPNPNNSPMVGAFNEFVQSWNGRRARQHAQADEIRAALFMAFSNGFGAGLRVGMGPPPGPSSPPGRVLRRFG